MAILTNMEGERGTGTDIGEETMSNVVKFLGEEDMLRGPLHTLVTPGAR
jgi:hypothetical protein